MRALVVVSVVVCLSFMGCPPPPCEGSSCSDAGSNQPIPVPQSGPEACVAQKNAYIDFEVRCGHTTAEYAKYRRDNAVGDCARVSTNANVLAATAACVQKIQNTSCLNTPTCDAVSGSAARGAQCFDTSECQADLYCDARSTCPGSCEPRIPLGESITSFEQFCVAGAYDYNNVCRAPVAEGASCAALSGTTFKQRCAAGLICTGAEVCTKGNEYAGLNEACDSNRYCGAGLRCLGAKCAKKLSAGAACVAQEDCQNGLACVGARCEPFFGKAGDTCENATGRYCDPGLFCNRTSSASAGTCAPRRSSGATCADGTQCAVGLFCAATSGPDGECRALVTVGGGCAVSEVCAGELFCSNNTCTYKKSKGASCSSFDECLGSCSGGVCTQPYCYAP